MLVAFLIGLAVVGTIVVVVINSLSTDWFITYCKKRLDKNKGHKVIFADMQDVVDEVVKNKVNNTTKMSLDELEKMCSESPYVAADYDPETDSVSDYEGFSAECIEERFKQKIAENDGMIIVDA